MSEKLALKKELFYELKDTNERIEKLEHLDYVKDDVYPSIIHTELSLLKHHKDFIQRLIDICVGRNKF